MRRHAENTKELRLLPGIHPPTRRGVSSPLRLVIGNRPLLGAVRAKLIIGAFEVWIVSGNVCEVVSVRSGLDVNLLVRSQSTKVPDVNGKTGLMKARAWVGDRPVLRAT